MRASVRAYRKSMKKKPLTEARIARMVYDPDGPARQIRYDPVFTGLGVRLYPSGNKSYCMQYGSTTGRRRVVLGSIKEHTLSDAKAWWQQQRSKERQGIDLVGDKKGAKQEIRDRSTVSALIEDYLADSDHEWSDGHLRNCKRHGRVVTEEFGTLRPEDVTRAHVMGLWKKLTQRGSPYSANSTRAFVHSLFAWASDPDQAYLPEAHPNPAHRRRRRSSKKAKRSGGVGKNLEHKRQRVLLPEEEEYTRLLRAADSTGNPRDGAIIRLFMLSGLRRQELLLRRWSDVDWKQRVLHIPGEGEGSTKNGEDHFVPLCDRAIEILKSIRDPQIISLDLDGAIFVRKDGLPLKSWQTTWLKIRSTAALRDWGPPDPGFRVQDIRRSVSTWLCEYRGFTDRETGLLLNHTPQAQSVTAMHYHSDLGGKLALNRRLVNELQEIMKICERGDEKEAFSTDGFAPALLASNGS
jgi:integrase